MQRKLTQYKMKLPLSVFPVNSQKGKTTRRLGEFPLNIEAQQNKKKQRSS